MPQTYLKSKLSKKIFIFFIAASFIPLFIATLISYYHVSNVINEGTTNRLKDASRDYGLEIFFRLKVAKDTLINNANNFLTTKNDIENIGINNINEFFSAVGVRDDKKNITIIYGEIDLLAITLSYNNNNRLISIKRSENKHDVFITLNNGIIGKVDSKYLWSTETLNSEIQFCVTNNALEMLFCEQSSPKDIIFNLKNSNKFTIDSANRHQVWDLFLDHEFNTDSWKIIASENIGIGKNKISEFTNPFIALIIFSLFLVVLLSSILIRKNLSSINILIDATKRIAGGNYKHTIDISPNDELRPLADSFNIMKENMGAVIQEYQAFSDIDKIILESVEKDKIIDSIMSNLQKIINFDNIHFFNGVNNSLELNPYYRYPKNEKDIQKVKKSEKSYYSYLNTLNLSSISFFDRINKIHFLDDLFEKTTKNVCILTIKLSEHEKGYICGGIHKDTIDDLTKQKLNSFLGRINIAFQALQREAILHYKANHDSLTALPNKNRLLSVNAKTLEANKQQNEALLFIDLDGFKLVNDNYGHTVGDKLLIEFSKRLNSIVRDEDIAARIGGDEFLVQLTEKNKEIINLRIPKLCEKIINAACTGFKIDNHSLHIGVSIGAFINENYEHSFSDALRYADIAMYFSKKNGGNQFIQYEQKMSDTLFKKSSLERDLRIALEDESIEVYYQIKVDSQTRKGTGFEALFRWNHPTYGYVSPVVAIELAESIGIIGLLGKIVFSKSIAQWQRWLEQGYDIGSIAINVSPKQLLESNFVDFVADTLKNYPLVLPGMVELEITENVMLTNKDEVLSVLEEIRGMGFNIAIDDFGTGYSSLSYLLDIPANILKIDRAFVIKMEQDPNALSLLTSLVKLGKSLNLTIVAEGVETEQQAAFLQNCETDIFQGYLFSKPLSAEQVEKRFLIEHNYVINNN